MSTTFAGGRTARRFAGPAIILLAALVAVAPQMIRGNSCGHDFDFHLVSWLDAQHGWRQGVLYPHWTSSANFGAGEPRFVFYPPLTWMLGAALGFLMPWQAVPIALTFLLLAGTGLAVRALACEFMTDSPSALAGCAAMYSGYALFTAYERSAFGELAGGIWIPLALLFLLRHRNPKGPLQRRAFDGSAAPLALAIAAAWLSNAPVGVMTCYLIAAVAVLLAALLRSWAPLLRAAVAGALGFGLAAIYLIPAAYEQRWVDIRQITQDPGEMIENSWLLARHTDTALQLHDMELARVSLIGITMIVVAFAGIFLLGRRGALKKPHLIPLALIPVAVLFLLLPISLPVWNTVPKLRFLQFPWRWLLVLEAPMAIFFAGAVWLGRRWQRVTAVVLSIVAFAAAVGLTGLFFFQTCDDEDAVIGMLDTYRSGAGFEGAYEYAPTGADNSQLATSLPAACLVSDPLTPLGHGEEGLTPDWDASQGSCDATFPFSGDRAEHVRVEATAAHAGYLILRLRNYPAWRIKVNGRAVSAGPDRGDGLISVAVPQGSNSITVDWTTTPDTLVGRWLTFLAAGLVTLLCVLERRQAALGYHEKDASRREIAHPGRRGAY